MLFETGIVALDNWKRVSAPILRTLACDGFVVSERCPPREHNNSLEVTFDYLCYKKRTSLYIELHFPMKEKGPVFFIFNHQIVDVFDSIHGLNSCLFKILPSVERYKALHDECIKATEMAIVNRILIHPDSHKALQYFLATEYNDWKTPKISVGGDGRFILMWTSLKDELLMFRLEAYPSLMDGFYKIRGIPIKTQYAKGFEYPGSRINWIDIEEVLRNYAIYGYIHLPDPFRKY